jgi:hypothetical protein
MPKNTPAQHFRDLFNRFIAGSTEHERAEGEKKMDAWLKRHGKTRIDAPKVLAQAAADDAAQQPPPPPSDPRDAQKHPFEDPRFTPAGLVLAVTEKYLTMTRHVATIYSLWICFTHVYTQFRIAPRLALVSELPKSGKTVTVDVAKCLVLRPNPEDYCTAAALAEHIDEGPGTVGVDEIDLVPPEVFQALLLIWNLGHKRGAKRGLVVKGKRKVVHLHAPMMGAGLGRFLRLAQITRTYILEMEQYTEETMPEKVFDETETADLDNVYRYLRQWAPKVKLDLKPPMPPGVIGRDADNARGLLAVAHACGPEWVQRLHEALTFFLEKAKSERPEIVMIRHGLAIFDMLEIDAIRSTRFHQELKRLDLPDARWTRYRGPSGTDTAHPLRPDERAALLKMVGIFVKKCKPPNEKQFRGYTLAQFEEAHRIHCAPGAGAGTPRLRLITPTSE